MERNLDRIYKRALVARLRAEVERGAFQCGLGTVTELLHSLQLCWAHFSALRNWVLRQRERYEAVLCRAVIV